MAICNVLNFRTKEFYLLLVRNNKQLLLTSRIILQDRFSFCIVRCLTSRLTRTCLCTRITQAKCWRTKKSKYIKINFYFCKVLSYPNQLLTFWWNYYILFYVFISTKFELCYIINGWLYLLHTMNFNFYCK